MHTVEETSRLLRLLVAAELRLQFFDTRIGALERLVLDECCLHQRVGGLRRVSSRPRSRPRQPGREGCSPVWPSDQTVPNTAVGSVNSGPPSMPDMPVAMPYPRS